MYVSKTWKATEHIPDEDQRAETSLSAGLQKGHHAEKRRVLARALVTFSAYTF